MGKISDCLYQSYQFLFLCFLLLSIVIHNNTIQKYATSPASYAAIYAFFILMLGGIQFAEEAQRQSPNEFVCHRVLLPVVVALINVLMVIHSCVGPNDALIITLHLLIFYTPFAFIQTTESYPHFQLKFLRTTVIPPAQLTALILIHAASGLAYYLFFANFKVTGAPELITNFDFVRHVSQISNILMIPLWIPALKAWNAERLSFKGKHPKTKKNWMGFMKRTGRNDWEVDLEPNDHNDFFV
uniref:Uncharacterized protein n=1 Tax=Caenorhabditis tropicalis TaxID=1561998 RepID=A0A1I7U554_9PELO